MKTPGRSAKLLTTLLWIASLLPACVATAQQTPPVETKSGAAAPATPLTPEEQRRKDLQADTEKLYKLTQELKAEVAKTDRNTLSVTVVKKAQEIERLAKSIKERSRSPR